VRASKVTRDKARLQTKKETDLRSLRGYCLVCNRHYFARNGLQTEALQLHQHHDGVCQDRNYFCARLFASQAWAETKEANGATANTAEVSSAD
jgi:hypothetical protein